MLLYEEFTFVPRKLPRKSESTVGISW